MHNTLTQPSFKKKQIIKIKIQFLALFDEKAVNSLFRITVKKVNLHDI